MSRPSMLTAERATKIIGFIAAGTDQETAALAAGISRATFFSWCARGRAEWERLDENPKAKPRVSEVPYLDFLDGIERARAEAETRLVILVNKAAQDPKNWRAALEMLERRYPQRWGKINRTEISGPDGSPIQSETTVAVSEADLRALADRIAGLGPVLPMIEGTVVDPGLPGV